MANQWALNANWDMYLGEDNEISRVAGVDEVVQHIRQRILFFFEEWFLDRDAGVPWFQEIYVKPDNQVLIDSILIREINNTPGVEEMLEFSSDIDFVNRVYRVITFTVRTPFGLATETI